MPIHICCLLAGLLHDTVPTELGSAVHTLVASLILWNPSRSRSDVDDVGGGGGRSGTFVLNRRGYQQHEQSYAAVNETEGGWRDAGLWRLVMDV